MEFTDVINQRRSNRAYKPDAIPEDILLRLQEALRVAPTGSNDQPFRFIFVTDADKRERITREACHQEFIGQAPIILAATCEPGRSFCTAIAVDHFILAAANEGLGTCWIGWFEREPVRKILNVDADKEIPILVTLGYAADSPDARPRKPLDELILFETYK